MFEFIVFVVERPNYFIEFALKVANLFFKAIDFSLGFGLVAYFEGVDLFCEHEDSIFGHMFG
jgi:hypothetical protein